MRVIGGCEVPVVDLYEIYTALGVKAHYRNWRRRRMADHNFIEGRDVFVLWTNAGAESAEAYEGQGGRRPGLSGSHPAGIFPSQTAGEFILLRPAKQLASEEKTPVGRALRRHLIACEERLYEIAPDLAAAETERLRAEVTGLHGHEESPDLNRASEAIAPASDRPDDSVATLALRLVGEMLDDRRKAHAEHRKAMDDHQKAEDGYRATIKDLHASIEDQRRALDEAQATLQAEREAPSKTDTGPANPAHPSENGTSGADAQTTHRPRTGDAQTASAKVAPAPRDRIPNPTRGANLPRRPAPLANGANPTATSSHHNKSGGRGRARGRKDDYVITLSAMMIEDILKPKKLN